LRKPPTPRWMKLPRSSRSRPLPSAFIT
jgi:hypothetical protein